MGRVNLFGDDVIVHHLILHSFTLVVNLPIHKSFLS